MVGGSFSPASPLSQPAKFSISSGESVFNIAGDLASKKIINSPFLFIVYSAVSGNFSRFQSGSYIISPGSNIREVVLTLTSGVPDISITIFPGMTLKEADTMLANDGIIKAGDLINLDLAKLKTDYPFLSKANNLEGFLMPDTYRIRPDYGSEKIAETILDNFSNKTKSLFSKDTDIYRTVIIASLLEKEVVSQADKELVSGIIEKRLSLGMPLQIDATVIYAACSGTFLDCRNITMSDYKSNSPYNTYANKGLPPAPIGNPTVDSIIAALSPKTSKYLYYLTDSRTHQTIFSATFNQHDENRSKYLGL